MNLGSIKTQLILFLGLFAAYLSIIEKDIWFLFSLLAAVISSIALESAWVHFKEKKFKITESSVITGLIVGFVLFSRPAWLMPIIASVMAILSKYLIRFKSKHIFNPAAFGILAAIMIFGTPTQWRGTYFWYILIPFGIYFALRIKKLEILYGYFAVALLLFGIQANFQGVSLFNIFNYLNYFFIFIILVEPKTTPVNPLGKILFGAAVAVLIFYFTEIGVKFDAEIAALLACNLAVPLLNKLK